MRPFFMFNTYTMKQPTIRPMHISDYDALIQLMQATPGISLRDADSREATERYLARNPDLSFIAEQDWQLIGCVMCGHDGRRGYLQHLIVLPEYRRQGIANQLVEHSLAQLELLGIYKTHIDVFRNNDLAQSYWESQGWQLRTDIVRYSLIRNSHENA